MAVKQGDTSSWGCAGWQGNGDGEPQACFPLWQMLPGCGRGAGRSTSPSHCFLCSQGKAALWKPGCQYGGRECFGWGEAHEGFFTCASPLRLNRKCFSHIPVCPSGCFGVGENTCWSLYNSHGFNANTEEEFQDLVKCGVFFSKSNLMWSSAVCCYIFWQSFLDEQIPSLISGLGFYSSICPSSISWHRQYRLVSCLVCFVQHRVGRWWIGFS